MQLDMCHNNCSGIKTFYQTNKLEKEIIEEKDFDLKNQLLIHNKDIKLSALYEKYGVYMLNKEIGKRVARIPSPTPANIIDVTFTDEQKLLVEEK